MIIVGGGALENGRLCFFRDGAIYHPPSQTWCRLAKAPIHGRRRACSAWTGKGFIVWGGEALIQGIAHSFNDGAIYDVKTDSWRLMSTRGAPSPRHGHSAVWTGRYFIVFGGGRLTESGLKVYADGAAYDPQEDTWYALPVDTAPAARFLHAAAWHQQKMFLWGGTNGCTAFTSGAFFDPASWSWIPLLIEKESHPGGWVDAKATVVGEDLLLSGGANPYVAALSSTSQITSLVPGPAIPYSR